MTSDAAPYLKRNRIERSQFDLLHHFYGQHHREVMAYALFFTKNNEEDAVDTLQDTFCAALESLQKGAEVDNPRSWLLKIARNSMLRRRERQVLETTSWQKYAEVTPLSENFTPKVLNGVLAESITDFIIRECTADEQEIFALRHFHEMNLADISEVVGQPLSNVHRVLDALTERVEKRYSNLSG
jgi:RNA polymerase sigma factor (sigma-70 family)